MTTPEPTLLINASQVRELLTWPALVEATRNALAALGQPDTSPPISSTQVHVPGAALHLKAGALLDPSVLTVKANLRPEQGSSTGAILVFDHQAQRLDAVLASGDLTAMRTAAIAAVGATTLVNGGDLDIAVVGAGPVAGYVIQALDWALASPRFRVWSRNLDRAADLRLRQPQIPMREVPALADVVRGADLIVTCTPSRQPLIELAHLTETSVIIALGADTPGKRELGPGVLNGAALYADVVVDALRFGECAYLEAGHTPQPQAFGALLLGQAQVPTGGRMVFDSVGSASVDAAAAALVVTAARSQGMGRPISLTG